MFTNMEGEMPAIERILEYQTLENEEKANSDIVSSKKVDTVKDNEGMLV